MRALARPGSERSLPGGVEVVLGDALRAETFGHAIAPADTVVHLVGTPRPSPLKAAQFQAALVHAVEHPPAGVCVVDVPAMRGG